MAKVKGPSADFRLGVAIGGFVGFGIGAVFTLILVHMMLSHDGIIPG